LYDPVDGADPLGIRPIFVITPGEKVNFTVPMMQIVTGLDPIPSSSNRSILYLQFKKIDYLSFKLLLDATGGACAPEDLSGKRFYDGKF